MAMMKALVSNNATPQPTQILGPPDVQKEWSRLASFNQFSLPEGIFVIPLAQNGFFLPEDRRDKGAREGMVECAFCSVVVPITSFVHARPMDVHRQVSPGCSVVQGQTAANQIIADAAQKRGIEFIGSYSKMISATAASAFGNPSRSAKTLSATPIADLATDAEVPAVERPAASCNALTSDKPAITGPSWSWQNSHTPAAGETVLDCSGADHWHNGTVPHQTATYIGPASATVTLPVDSLSSASDAERTETSSNVPAGEAASGQTEPGQGGQVTGASGTTSNSKERQTVTYEDLGIVSQRPKRPDMAVTQTRINTFSGWKHESTHPKDEMAEAGFYYTGHEDLVRCFHCKGGLKTWESSDTPWVEHARWFPRCPFIKLCKGQRYINAVQSLNDPNTRPTISEDAVLKRIMILEVEEQQKLNEDLKLSGKLPPKPDLHSHALTPGCPLIDSDLPESKIKEMAEQYEAENEEIRNLTLCKMCQTNEVNVLFLPCGHLVACAQCAPALTTCAMCRQPVKGSVRVHLDDNKLDSGHEVMAAAPTDHSPLDSEPKVKAPAPPDRSKLDSVHKVKAPSHTDHKPPALV